MKNIKEYIANYLREAQEIIAQTTAESQTSRTGNAAPDISSKASPEQLRKLEEELTGERNKAAEEHTKARTAGRQE
jgi:hypothetical protein